MLTKGQWKYLGYVAKEGILKQPTSGKFLTKYKIGTPAASKRYLEALIDKELIYLRRPDFTGPQLLCIQRFPVPMAGNIVIKRNFY